MDIISWTAGSSDFNNQKSLTAIQQWWIDLEDKSVTLIKETKILNSDVMSGSPDTFTVQNPHMQGNILIWSKPGFGNEWNVTAQQLYLNKSEKQLKIVPQDMPDCLYHFTVNSVE